MAILVCFYFSVGFFVEGLLKTNAKFTLFAFEMGKKMCLAFPKINGDIKWPEEYLAYTEDSKFLQITMEQFKIIVVGEGSNNQIVGVLGPKLIPSDWFDTLLQFK